MCSSGAVLGGGGMFLAVLFYRERAGTLVSREGDSLRGVVNKYDQIQYTDTLVSFPVL